MSQSTFELLRFVHILAGVFWTGTVVMLALFLEPVIRSAGPAGGRIMHDLMEGRRLAIYLTVAGWLTILAGIPVFWRTSAHLNDNWMSTNVGIAYSIGGAAAIVEAFLGTFINARDARQIGIIGSRLQKMDGPPPAADLALMSRLQERLKIGSRLGAALLILATSAMAAARYL